MARTAILIDGGFYRKRIQKLKGDASPRERAKELINYCYSHLENKDGEKVDELYRIFYYDCPPLDKKLLHPLTKKPIDYSTTELYQWTHKFLYEMTRQRKVALRLGFLSESKIEFRFTDTAMKGLFNGTLKFEDLREQDILPDVKQKGVDMKIGVDIASVAYKKQAEKIVLIAGDSDFVPASKLARREGIDFVLDPLWAHINPDLFEHIDGMITKFQKPSK
ncbi:MAG: NYN domain-containing protein [Clostridiales bacterium]|nr:NYN domain-containing protein [Clostridiales bacterium]